MKRLVAFIMCAVFLVTFTAGCGKDKTPEDTRDIKQILYENRNTFRDANGQPYIYDTQTIVENLPFKESFDFTSLDFYTSEPFEVIIRYSKKENKDISEDEFIKNAYVIFSLCEQIYLVSFQIEGTNKTVYYNRDEAFDIYGDDLYLHTETYDDFVKVFNKINSMDFSDRHKMQTQ